LENRLAGERQILLDAILVGLMDSGAATQAAAPFGIFGLHQMAAARAQTQYFATGCDLKALGCRFSRFDAFWTSHNFLPLSSKKSAQYRSLLGDRQELF
jgi:hypothetical protein